VQPGKGYGVRLEAAHAIAANRMGVFKGAPRGLAAPLKKAFVFDFARGSDDRRAQVRQLVWGVRRSPSLALAHRITVHGISPCARSSVRAPSSTKSSAFFGTSRMSARDRLEQ
jgi:hypothetical protein